MPTLALIGLACVLAGQPDAAPTRLRVATFNVEDLRTEELLDPSNERVRAIAEVLRRVRPNVVLLNEIAYDQAGAPGYVERDGAGANGRRLAEAFLAVTQGAELEPLRVRAFMAPVNTGMPSGFDLDNDGRVVATMGAGQRRGDAASEAARAYANDCWGFGTFPGQYGMALLVDERLEILVDRVRTFRLLPWDYVSGNFIPREPEPWFDEKELEVARLSSKSHWDVPVRLPGGQVVHFLCSHPTPPVFDGPEDRNGRRNHDEIRFWADYLSNEAYIVDDRGVAGGLEAGAHFVVLGDLNADPDEGDAFKDPIGTLLETQARIRWGPAPVADRAAEGLDADDTAAFGLRVDYVLPSRTMGLVKSGVWRWPPRGRAFPSDHFPLWAEIEVPE